MKSWFTASLIFTLAFAQIDETFGQPPQRQRPDSGGFPGARGGSPAGRSDSSSLKRSGLKIGQQLPDVIIHDENGEKFPLSRVKGKHTVLVFGCLT